MTIGTRRVGRYLLGERIGSGGMSDVRVAVEVTPLGLARAVAIKELHPHLARDADFVSMLVQEARIQGALEHPNVVRLVDAIAEDGELFLVLGLVDGVSLAELRKSMPSDDARVPLRVAVRIACDIFEGLHAAHELRSPDGARADVVHRDVSTHNVVLGSDGVARILDFGVAKAVARAQVTRDGALKGKPTYMSPEQLAGERVDRRSDVYSAALVLAELLVGARVRPAGDVPELRAWIERELDDPVAWLRAREVTEPVARALGACLARDVDARPPTARDAARALADAEPPCTAGEVAEWLARVAGAALECNREKVARALSLSGEATLTEPTHTVSPRARDDAAGEGHRPRPTSGYLAIAALLLAGGGFVCGRGAAESPAAARNAQPASTSGENVAATPPVAAMVSASASAAATPEAPSVAPSASARPSASDGAPHEPPARAVRTSHAPRPTPRAASSSRCQPPYTLDAAGVRVFKPECL